MPGNAGGGGDYATGAPPATEREPAPGEPAGTTARWRRALALLWIGQVISHLGDALFLVGSFFLALEVTGSKSLSGVMVAMNFLPALALGLFAGAFVDRHDRRRVMIAADLLRAFAVGSIPLLHAAGLLTILPLAIAMFALATGTTLFNPAIKALLPEMIPAARLTSAAAIFQVSEYAALVMGPALASLFIPRLGPIHLFSLDAVTFLASAACLLALPREARRLMHRAPAAGQPLGEQLRGITRGVREGLRTVRATPVIRTLMTVNAFASLGVMGLAHVATPLLVKERLGLGADAYAQAQSFFFLGMATATALFWAFGRSLPKGRLILVGFVLDGLTFIPFAFCQTLFHVEMAMFLHAASIPIIIIPRTVLIQQSIPGALHGRIFSLVNVSVFGMTALSSGAVGFLSEHFRAETLFLAIGALASLPGTLGFLSRSLRTVR